jgi:hypothetical protein
MLSRESKSVPAMWTPSLASTSSPRDVRRRRSGDSRITVKSAVPPPTSITSTVSSRSTVRS